jgi:hypothetical protein
MVKKEDSIIVEGQQYGLGNKLRENLTPQGWRRSITEKLSPQFAEKMENLRHADESARDIALNLKPYLGQAHSAFKAGRFLDVAHWTSEINNAVKGIMRYGKNVVDLRDSELAEYYTRHEHADPNSKYFEDSTEANDGMEITAGITDYLNRYLGTSLEKTYWKRVKERKLAVQSLLKRTDLLVAVVLASLNKMGVARAKGNINDWIVELQRIGQVQIDYQKFAKGIFDKHLADLVELARSKQPVKKEVPVPAVVEPKSTNHKIPDLEVEEENLPIPLNSKEPFPIMERPEELRLPVVPDLTNSENKPVDVKLPVDVPRDETTSVINKNVVPGIPEVPALDIAPEVKPAKQNFESVPVVQQVHMNNHYPGVEKSPEVPVVTPAVQKREPGRPRLSVQPEKELSQWEKLREFISKGPGVESTQPAVNVAPKVEEVVAPVAEVAPKAVENPFTSTPDVPVASVKPEVKPEIRAPKKPLHVNIVGKPPQETKPKEVAAPKLETPKVEPIKESPNVENIPSSVEENSEPVSSSESKPVSSSENKITLIVLPKGGVDNLDVLKENLINELGHNVEFVTKETGKEAVYRYSAEDYDIDIKTYDEVKEFAKPGKVTNKTLDRLNDPKFISKLPRAANGDFHMPLVLDKSMFAGIDKETRQAVVNKLLKIREDEISGKSEETKPVEPSSVEEVKEEKAPVKIEEKKPEEKKPEVKPAVEKPKEKVPEVKKEPKHEESKKSEEFVPDAEDEEAQAIYKHTGKLEELLNEKGRSLRTLTKLNILDLMENPKYIAILPKNEKGEFDTNLIKKFPEFLLLDRSYQNSFLKQLKEMSKPKRRTADPVLDSLIKLSHQRFFVELNKIAQMNDPGLMAAMLCKYSEEIEDLDLETSIKLIHQAQNILDD